MDLGSLGFAAERLNFDCVAFSSAKDNLAQVTQLEMKLCMRSTKPV